MKILAIGDIVGRPGREMLRDFLPKLKEHFKIDFVVANYENASHGFGLTPKNANELFSYGVDCLTGGNHTWDKKEIIPLLSTHNILRPFNLPDEVDGEGYKIFEVGDAKLCVVNLMGYHSMPMCENPFRKIDALVKRLHEDGIQNIIIDFHAESSAEKRGMMMLLQGRVSAIYGTHTHVGSDDLQIANNTCYVSDIGLTGCRDNVIGMDKKAPLQQFMTGVKAHYDIPKRCKKILQAVVIEIEDAKAVTAKKIKLYGEFGLEKIRIEDAFIEKE